MSAPANPTVFPHDDLHQRGITLHDLFAGMALASAGPLQPIGSGDASWSLHRHEAVAAWCYARADAMLAERERH